MSILEISGIISLPNDIETMENHQKKAEDQFNQVMDNVAIVNAMLDDVMSHLSKQPQSSFGQYVDLNCCFCEEMFGSLEVLERHEMNVHGTLNSDRRYFPGQNGKNGNPKASDKHLSALQTLVMEKSPAKSESVQNLIQMLMDNLIDPGMFMSNLEYIIYH